jgi:hypothetical protein
MTVIGTIDNGRVANCRQRWHESDIRDVAAIQGPWARWHIWMLSSCGEPDRELTRFNRGWGYASLASAKRAWRREVQSEGGSYATAHCPRP